MCALAVAMVSGGQNVKWQDLYKVKKKDTIYGIAKKFNITIEELQNANPGMKKSDYVLKKGDQLLIPFPTMSKVNTPAQSPETARPHYAVCARCRQEEGNGRGACGRDASASQC